ncbi:MAG: beta-galactosidase [Pseudomonadota bacterium]
MTKPELGVCYYPEHWPEEIWAEDARQMVDLGLTWVRIGEFAWSRLEPARGQYEFDWLERAIDILASAGLKIVLGTPTATPPKWLVDEMPDMLAVDADGQTRGFGSRRHYCFSHDGYFEECRRITNELSKRFGANPGVHAWQTDNEHGCHDTVHSYSPSALREFRIWLSRKYQSPDALNRAWGNVFWSMEYASFDEIELPNLTVTEANPSHWMDFHRFSSEQVVKFNHLQVEIIRRHSPERPIIHNFMGRTLSFDHFDLGADLDISSWDSYPLGFLSDRSDRPSDFALRYAKSGDPDFQAFHHDLYRATSGGRWWVMEQQPGPVNWASHNTAPYDGMVRLWSWEAIAHGAEVVSYFRWRQAPFGQEQMHSGILRPDSVPAHAFSEVSQTASELATIGEIEIGKSDAAIVFDYPSAWAWKIQPQGVEFDYFRLVYDHYCALRRLGLSIDFQNANNPDLSDYKLVLVPGLFAWNEQLLSELRKTEAQIVVGPRSGSKTADFRIPEDLPPDLHADLLDLKIARVESCPENLEIAIPGTGKFKFWREHADVGASVSVPLDAEDGSPALIRQGNKTYLAGWGDDEFLQTTLREITERAGLSTIDVPEGLSLRRNGKMIFAFNYSRENINLNELGIKAEYLLGGSDLAPSGVAIGKLT